MKNSKAIKMLAFALPVILAIGIIIAAVMSFSLEEPPLSLYFSRDFNDGWIREGSGSPVPVASLPLVLGTNNGTVILSKTLPDKLDENAVLGVKVLYQKIKVYVGDKLIYEMGYKDQAPFGKAYGYLWSFIPLSDEYAGQKITIAYVSPFNAKDMTIEGILIGSETSVFLRIISNNLFLIILCGVLLIVGIFYMVIRLILQYKYPKAEWNGLTYLAAFFILVVTWLITDSDLTQFIPGGRTICYLTSFFSFMLMPIPFLRFLEEISSKKRKSLFVLTVLFSLNVIFCTLLYVFNVLDLIQSIDSTHFLMLVSILVGGAICGKELKNNNTTIRDIAIGTVCLFIGSLIALFQYYCFKTQNSIAFKCGLILFVFFISSAAIRRYLHMLNESVSAEAYKRLAYTDSLTGLGNRTAFSEAVELLQKNKAMHESITFLVFDIDNLKPVNDSFGHIKGDELIRTVSRCLNNVFSGTGQCFRIGGDEFAAIVSDVPEAEINKQLEKLERCIKVNNEGEQDGIGLSIGFEFCTKDSAASLSMHEIFSRADAKMYKNKRSKECPSRR